MASSGVSVLEVACQGGDKGFHVLSEGVDISFNSANSFITQLIDFTRGFTQAVNVLKLGGSSFGLNPRIKA